MNYMQLTSQVEAYVANGERPILPPPGWYQVGKNGALLDSGANVVAQPGSYVIAVGGANVINAGGANVINAGGANVMTPQPGMLIAPNLSARAVQSVGGKRVIMATQVQR